MRTIVTILVTMLLGTIVVAANKQMQKDPSKHDINVMADFLEYSGAWNQSTGPIVRDYEA